MNRILKLKPFYSEKIWGYEEWSLSTHKNGLSTIESTNKTLKEVIGHQLPIIIKIIQANDTLSVQVHPDDEYSKKYENDNGKTECWYILEAKDDASLICGIKPGLSKEKFSKIIKDGSIENYLQKISVKSGDMVYIPAGTVHAIEGGLKIIEVQQSSDITYRIYDWGRDREMHIRKSLDVIDYEGKNQCGKIVNFKKLKTNYFTVEKLIIEDVYKNEVKSDFHSYTVISGIGYITDGKDKIDLNKEETIYIPKGVYYEIYGELKLIKSYI